jgi:hypothetical protein
MGYIISGTTKDGTYLEVRDADTDVADDITYDYFLDTPPGEDPNGNWDDDTELPLTAGRYFTPGATAGAELLTNPLWYAAKWGSFLDHNFNGKPDLTAEWDENEDGTPDNYFYVQNPLLLERQLNQAFLAILERATSGTSASVLSASRSGEGATYQSIFYPKYKNVSWVGDVHSLLVDAYGQIREDTNSNLALDNAADKVIEFDAFSPGVVNKYTDTNGDGELTACGLPRTGSTPCQTLRLQPRNQPIVQTLKTGTSSPLLTQMVIWWRTVVRLFHLVPLLETVMPSNHTCTCSNPSPHLLPGSTRIATQPSRSTTSGARTRPA